MSSIYPCICMLRLVHTSAAEMRRVVSQKQRHQHCSVWLQTDYVVFDVSDDEELEPPASKRAQLDAGAQVCNQIAQVFGLVLFRQCRQASPAGSCLVKPFNGSSAKLTACQQLKTNNLVAARRRAKPCWLPEPPGCWALSSSANQVQPELQQP